MYLYHLLVLTFMFGGLWIFSSKREHLLSVLLSLEFMVLCIFFIFYFFLSFSSIFYSLVYLTFAACEGALGLSVLVIMSRTHGGDYFKSFSFY
uniref:NADH-ubiquinone oxidoreductase chain 4L n=1 Tax=Kaylathalia klovstadi TaxID=2778773 RepID=A0A7T6Y705_9HEXA|nr:NADH dehydrogenase subunit 4L [Kaylathalia klovstadi]QQK54740.1 NADH dehydrogenase subunit 4L [Kaylathalia klovstadi]